MRAYLAALGVTAVVALFIASRPEPYALNGDAEMLLHPLLTDAYRQLAAGRLPLWTTGRWGGSPLIADAVIGALYPPYYLAYALTPFPHWRALDVSVVLHAALLATGLVWFLRRLGANGRAGVACGAFLMLSPTYVFITRNWHEYWAALAYWPWLFGAAVTLARAPRVGMGLLAAGALAGPVYAGYPEFGLYAGIPALLWIPLAPGAQRWRRLALAVLVGAGAVALALPQVLPGLVMAGESIRFGPGGAERLDLLGRFFVLSPSDWLAMVRPLGAPPGTPVKLAPNVAVLALLGACDRRATVRWLVVSALVSGVLATGPNPVYAVLHGIPPFSFFGAPLKFFYLTNFLLLVLAGLGLARVPTLSLGRRRALVVVLALGLVLSFGDDTGAAWIAGVGGVLLAAVPARALGSVAGATAIAGSVVFLLATRALELPSPFTPGVFMTLVRRPVSIRPTPGARSLTLIQDRSLRQVGLNYGALWGIESWNGMGDLVQWRQAGVLEDATPGAAARLSRALAADPVIVQTKSALLAELEASGFRRTAETAGLAFLSPPDAPLARAALAARAKAVPAAVAIATAREGHILDHGRVLIEADTLPGGAHGDAGGRVAVVEDSPGATRIQVTVARPTWLVVRHPYYVNWQGTIDDRPLPLYPAGGFLLGMLVDAGTHDVRLDYRERGLGAAVALAAMTVVLLPLGLRRIIRGLGSGA